MASADPQDYTIAAEIAGIAGRYRLSLGAQRFRGRMGGRRGYGVGSSQEFFDFRDYAPGDDLRYIDWRGYARTEQLRIRLHQEEVAPYVDILVDTSASLRSTPGKERAARLLASSFVQWAKREGAVARLSALGGGEVLADELTFEGPTGAPMPPVVPLRPGGVRVLLTDGLWPEDPAPGLLRLMAGAARFFCVQLLDPWELEPQAEGAMTLVDCESGLRAEVQLDARAVAAYRERLQRLLDGLRIAVVGHGGDHAVVRADALAMMCSRDLLPAAVLEPA